MLKGHKLIPFRQVDQRLTLPTGLITGNQIETLRGEHEEPAIDQAAIATRLFHETGHRGAFHLQGSVAARGLNGSDRRPFAVLFVEGDLARDIYVRSPSPYVKQKASSS
jgi:hypothetical protein